MVDDVLRAGELVDALLEDVITWLLLDGLVVVVVVVVVTCGYSTGEDDELVLLLRGLRVEVVEALERVELEVVVEPVGMTLKGLLLDGARLDDELELDGARVDEAGVVLLGLARLLGVLSVAATGVDEGDAMLLGDIGCPELVSNVLDVVPLAVEVGDALGKTVTLDATNEDEAEKEVDLEDTWLGVDVVISNPRVLLRLVDVASEELVITDALTELLRMRPVEVVETVLVA